MDPLSDALHLARFTGAAFLEARFTAPWAVRSRMPGTSRPQAKHLVHYHLITEGRCMAALPGEEPVWLEAGDLILFPRGEQHELASAIGLPTVPADDLIGPVAMQAHRLEYGGGGSPTRMLCGFLSCDPHVCKPMLAALPRMMRIQAGTGHFAAWYECALQYTQNGSIVTQPGGAAVIAKLAEILFVEAVRRYIDALPPDQQGWLAGLRDPSIGRALALMHDQPAHPWTVDELGRQVAMSRSSLAMRFTQVLGQPPMAYLAAWRMRLAAQMLIADEQPIVRIAEETGYESESSFNRAFKRSYGIPPATFRREHSRSRMPQPARTHRAAFDGAAVH
ncbi:MAG TPA: AraC family transcriptional regulator [Burkholderiales bacterium]|nr:AraC family transcriptional regulator [Burkholderiales bacterium]